MRRSAFFAKCLRVTAGLAAVGGLAVVLPPAEQPTGGRDGTTIAAQREVPAVEAYFARESYRPGSTATRLTDDDPQRVSARADRDDIHADARLVRDLDVAIPTCGPGREAQQEAAYGWPVKPFHRQHPVRGYFGDPRIGNGGASRSLHFGVDVSAPDGTAVYATVAGTVDRHPLHDDVVVIHGADGVDLEYWHVIPAVSSGRRATAYRTVIGHIEKPWAHVHVSERRNGVYVNPLRPGAMGPYADETCPAARTLSFERRGNRLRYRALRGSFDIVLEAADAPAMSAPQPWFELPVTPALIRWSIVDRRNRTVRPWRTAFDVRERLPEADYHGVYVDGTAQNHPDRPGLYRFRLATGFSAGSLRAGDYALRVAVRDSRGNRALSSWPFSVAATS